MFTVIRGRTCFVNFLSSGSGSLASIGLTRVDRESHDLSYWSKETLAGSSQLLIDSCSHLSGGLLGPSG